MDVVIFVIVIAIVVPIVKKCMSSGSNAQETGTPPVNMQQQPRLIPCPDCGKQNSRLAEVCPHCGRPTELKRAADQFKTMVKDQDDRDIRYNPIRRISRLFGGK
jgi:hypothetical protein